MKEIKVFSILDTLSEPDLQKFTDFINSPFFNKNPQAGSLLEIYVKMRSSANPLTYSEMYEVVFPGEEYSPRKMSDICYLLLKLLKEYFAHSFYKNQDLLKIQHLLETSFDSGLEKISRDAEREYMECIAKPIRNSERLYFQYTYNNLLDRQNIVSGKMDEKALLQNKMDSLDLFYLEEKLKGSCEMYNRGRIMQADYRFSLLQPLLASLKEEENQHFYSVPSISVYCAILELFNESNAGHFDVLMQIIQEHSLAFIDEELREIYGYVQNYCIRKINEGDATYYQRLYLIYQRLIENNLICRDNIMNQWDYKNITSLGLRLGEFDWTHDFIEGYKEKLQVQHKKNAYTYNLANYYYEIKNYKNAIRLLQSVEYSDVYYRLDATTMLLKMYFELEEEDAFLSQAAAFKVYLKRNKLISERNYTLYMNLVKLSGKVFNLKMKPYYHKNSQYYRKLAELKTKVNSTSVINNKWLLEKIRELAPNEA